MLGYGARAPNPTYGRVAGTRAGAKSAGAIPAIRFAGRGGGYYLSSTSTSRSMPGWTTKSVW